MFDLFQGEIQSMFLRHEGYLGAIGAFLKGAEEEGTPFFVFPELCYSFFQIKSVLFSTMGMCQHLTPNCSVGHLLGKAVLVK